MRRGRVMIALTALSLAYTLSSASAAPTAREVQDLIRKIEARFGVKLSPVTPQAAINANHAALQRMRKTTIGVSISESAITKVLTDKFREQKAGLSQPRVDFRRQQIVLSAVYEGEIEIPNVGVAQLRANVQGSLSPALSFDGPTGELVLRLSADDWGVDVTRLRLRNAIEVPLLDKAVEGAAEIIVNRLLQLLQAAVTRAEVRLPTLLSPIVRIKTPPPIAGVVFTVEPRQFTVPVKITGVAYLVEDDRLTVLLEESGTAAPNAPSTTNVPYDDMRKAFQALVGTAKAPWLMRSELGIYVGQDLVTTLAEKSFAGLSRQPLCLSASVKEKGLTIKQTIPLPPASTIDCQQRAECRSNRDCAQHEDCRSNRECRSRRPDRKLRCEAEKVAARKACEIRKVRRKGQCEAEKLAQEAACEARKVAAKGSCEAVKEAYDTLRRGGKEFGRIEGDNVALNGNGTVCLNSVKYDQKTMTLSAQLTSGAEARLNGKIKFTPLNLTGHLACVKPFAKDLKATIQAPTQPIDLRLTVESSQDGNRAGLTAQVAGDIRLQIPFESLLSQLSTDPEFIVSCPLAQGAGTVRLLTPDQWWPRAARGVIDLHVPSYSIEHDFVRKPAKIEGYRVVGKVIRGDTGFGGSFSLAK